MPKAKPKAKPKGKPRKKSTSAFEFNARGERAAPFRPNAALMAPGFCDIPVEVLTNVAWIFGVQKEMMDIAMNYTRSTFCDILSLMLPVPCMREWKITHYLGSGTEGFVFGCRSRRGSNTGALKIQPMKDKNATRRQIQVYKKFAALGLSPKIHSHCTKVKTGSTVLFLNVDRIDTTLKQWLMKRRSPKMIDLLVRRLFDVLRVMRENGLTHGDFHVSNIGFVFKRDSSPGKIQIIDHGDATTKGALTETDLVQFMRTVMIWRNELHGETSKYLQRRFRAEALRQYGVRLSQSPVVLTKRLRILLRELAELERTVALPTFSGRIKKLYLYL